MIEGIRQGDIPGVQLRCRQDLATSVGEAWLWLTEPQRLARWMATKAELDPGLEGELKLESIFEGKTLRELGSTLEIAVGRRWVLAFRRLEDDWPVATRLTFDLKRKAGGCELSAFQEGFAHLPLSDCLTIWEAYRRRWHAALLRLSRQVETA